MKSIMQEASSIAKAVEQAWIKAGKPQNFSIKVFEEAQKNFIGMTTKPAKIAFLFNEQSSPMNRNQTVTGRQEQPSKTKQPQRQTQSKGSKIDEDFAQRNAQVQTSPKKNEHVERAAKDSRHTEREIKEKRQTIPAAATTEKVFWTPELVEAVNDWLKNSVETLSLKDISFKIATQEAVLTVVFSGSLASTNEKQRHLFKCFAFLLMQSLRHRFKRSLRNLRVILTTEKHATA